MSEVREEVPCPLCGEAILAAAQKCKHCRSYLGNSDAVPRADANAGSPPAPAAPPVTVAPPAAPIREPAREPAALLVDDPRAVLPAAEPRSAQRRRVPSLGVRDSDEKRSKGATPIVLGSSDEIGAFESGLFAKWFGILCVLCVVAIGLGITATSDLVPDLLDPTKKPSVGGSQSYDRSRAARRTPDGTLVSGLLLLLPGGTLVVDGTLRFQVTMPTDSSAVWLADGVFDSRKGSRYVLVLAQPEHEEDPDQDLQLFLIEGSVSRLILRAMVPDRYQPIFTGDGTMRHRNASPARCVVNFDMNMHPLWEFVWRFTPKGTLAVADSLLTSEMGHCRSFA